MSLSNHNCTPLQAEMKIQLRSFTSGAVLYNQKVAERLGLHLTDMQCVNLLDILGASTPGRLAECMGLTTGGVTVVLDRLEKSGFIKREPNPEDRRSVLVRVNPRKMEKINAQYAEIAAQFDGYVQKLPEESLAILIDFFRNVNVMRMNAVGAKRRAG